MLLWWPQPPLQQIMLFNPSRCLTVLQRPCEPSDDLVICEGGGGGGGPTVTTVAVEMAESEASIFSVVNKSRRVLADSSSLISAVIVVATVALIWKKNKENKNGEELKYMREGKMN